MILLCSSYQVLTNMPLSTNNKYILCTRSMFQSLFPPLRGGWCSLCCVNHVFPAFKAQTFMHNQPRFQERYWHINGFHHSDLTGSHVTVPWFVHHEIVPFLESAHEWKGESPKTANCPYASTRFHLIVFAQLTPAAFSLPGDLREKGFLHNIVSNEQCVSSLLLFIYLFCFSNWLRLNCILLYNCERTCGSHLY